MLQLDGGEGLFELGQVITLVGSQVEIVSETVEAGCEVISDDIVCIVDLKGEVNLSLNKAVKSENLKCHFLIQAINDISE